MPNENNILEPITLTASVGRSGTSLLQDIFARHNQFEICGETQGLLFGVWRGVEISPMKLLKNDFGQMMCRGDQAMRVVRAAFLAAFNDLSPKWFHKPIGLPKFLRLPVENGNYCNFPHAWYWHVFKASFPNAKYFTVLRNPCDVVLSRQEYSGWEQKDLWKDIAVSYEMILHEQSPINKVIFFEDLIQDPENVIRDLFDYLEIEYQKQCMRAFDKIHVPTPGRENMTSSDVSRKKKWNNLDKSSTNSFQINILKNTWLYFGRELQLPSQFDGL